MRCLHQMNHRLGNWLKITIGFSCQYWTLMASHIRILLYVLNHGPNCKYFNRFPQIILDRTVCGVKHVNHMAFFALVPIQIEISMSIMQVPRTHFQLFSVTFNSHSNTFQNKAHRHSLALLPMPARDRFPKWKHLLFRNSWKRQRT